MAETVNEDLLSCDADVIVQQCNTVTRRSHGLSASIARRFPYADVYACRSGSKANTASKPETPGTAVLCRPPPGDESQPIVACLMAQLAPGKPGGWCAQYKINAEDDTAARREEYFREALHDLAMAIRDSDGTRVAKIAFPHGIGCGLAGGSWPRYEAMIDQFARSLPGVKVRICKLKL